MAPKRKAAASNKLSQEVHSSSDEDNVKPTAKKVKQFKAKKEESSDEKQESADEKEADEEPAEEEEGALEKNDDGDSFLRLSTNRRVTVRSFKGATLIDIRETYDKDGKTGLPGKKGISLSKEQFQTLKKSIGLIDEAIEALG